MQVWQRWLLAALCIAMFLAALGRREFAASHEARVAQTAREMAAAGWPWNATPVQVDGVRLINRLGVKRLAPDPQLPPVHVNPWIVPVLNGEIRLQKPPLPYWCAAVMFRFFGTSEGAARLVPALLGILATFLLYHLTAILFGRQIAWCAALIWLTTYLVSEYYRIAMADPYVSFATLACLWAWVGGSGFRVRAEGSGFRVQGSAQAGGASAFRFSLTPEPRTLNPFLLLFYASLGIGALAKGPVILLVAIPIALYHVCFRARFPRSWLNHLIGIALFATITLPWVLEVGRSVGWTNAWNLWRYESIGELSGENQEGVRAWWYYLVNLPLLALPWLALWLYSLIYPFRHLRRRALFPFLWYAAMVLVFTYVPQKKLPYLQPMLPAQAMMIAIAAVPMLRLARRNRMKGLPGGIVAVQVVIGIGFAAALPAFVWEYRDVRTIAIVVSALLVCIAILPIRQMLGARPLRWFVAQSLVYVALLLAFYNLVLTTDANARSPKVVCQQLAALADGWSTAILESKLPEEVAFYLPLHPRQGPAPSHYLVVLDDQQGVKARKKSKRPLADPDEREFEGWVPDATVAQVRRVQLKDATGDSRWKVYELTVRRPRVFARG